MLGSIGKYNKNSNKAFEHINKALKMDGLSTLKRAKLQCKKAQKEKFNQIPIQPYLEIDEIKDREHLFYINNPTDGNLDLYEILEETFQGIDFRNLWVDNIKIVFLMEVLLIIPQAQNHQ